MKKPVRATMVVKLCYRTENVSPVNFASAKAYFVKYEKKVSMHVNIMARNLVQRQSLPNTFTYKILLMNHEELAILFPFFNFFAVQTPSPNKCLLNTREGAENNGYQA